MTLRYRKIRESALGATIAAALVAGLATPSFAQAEYRLAAGDVLELSAVGVPELKQRAQIGQDGTVSLPLAGPLHVKGLTLAEVRTKLRQLLPSKEFRRRTEEGREYPVILAPTDVDVAIAEYRPVYINGDVSKPGEIPFRPGLTVRQAVALAGGYDIMRFRMNNPFLEQADLKSEFSSLWTEFAKEQVHVARLQAELEDREALDVQTLEKAPVPRAVRAEIERLAADQLALRNTDFSKERTYLKEALAKEDHRIRILSDQSQKEQAGVEADQEELQRLQELLQKGNVVIQRVVDARRSLLLSSTRQLETAAQLATVERQRQEFSRRSEKLDDQRRLDLIAELQEANLKLATIRAKLEASSEKLMYVGMIRSQLVRGTGSKPVVTLYRKNDKGGHESTTVEEDADLRPGDVVEIALQGDLTPAPSAR